MDYKEEFTQLIEENRLEDARILLERHKLYASEEPLLWKYGMGFKPHGTLSGGGGVSAKGTRLFF